VSCHASDLVLNLFWMALPATPLIMILRTQRVWKGIAFVPRAEAPVRFWYSVVFFSCTVAMMGYAIVANCFV